jgi:HEAT repeat protein
VYDPLAFVKDPDMSVSAHPDLLIGKLIEKLHDRDARTRRNAAGALRLLGARAAGAAPELSTLLTDDDPHVRCEAERALDHLRFA